MMFFLLLLLPKATKYGTFQRPPSLEPSKGHQAWNLPRATNLKTFHWTPSKMFFHWPPSIGFISKATKHGTFQGRPSLEPSIGHQVGSSLTSFLSLLLKSANLDDLSLYFQTWFLIFIFENLLLQLSLGGEEWLVLINGGEREIGW